METNPAGEGHRTNPINQPPEACERRGGPTAPIWSKLNEHETDIRELYKTTARAHERVNSTNETVLYLREDIREWKEQTHRDSTNILKELRASNERMAVADQRLAEQAGVTQGRWEAVKVGLPIGLTVAGLTITGLVALNKLGMLGAG